MLPFDMTPQPLSGFIYPQTGSSVQPTVPQPAAQQVMAPQPAPQQAAVPLTTAQPTVNTQHQQAQAVQQQAAVKTPLSYGSGTDMSLLGAGQDYGQATGQYGT